MSALPPAAPVRFPTMLPILAAVQAIPGVTAIEYGPRYKGGLAAEYLHATVPGLYLQCYRDLKYERHHCQEGERRYTLRLAQRSTFDRWANSTNFVTDIWYDPEGTPHWTIPDLARTAAWCRRACRSGLFDFNSYFDAVKAPWFIHPVKRRR